MMGHPPNVLVTSLHPSDVLFGRGSGANDHDGNIRFRALVAERKDEYMATNHRMTKAQIARSIVNQVLQADGRFLKRLEPDEVEAQGLPPGVDAWMTVDDDTIMEKAKQALRQNTQKGGANKEASASSPLAAPANQVSQHSTSHAAADDYDDFEPFPLTTSSAAVHTNHQGMPPPPVVVPSSGGVGGSSNWQQQMHYGQERAQYGQAAPANVTVISGDTPQAPPPPSQRMDLSRQSLAVADLQRDQNAFLAARNSRMSMSSQMQTSLLIDDLMDSFANTTIHQIDGGPAVVDSANAGNGGGVGGAADQNQADLHRKFYSSTDTMGTIDMMPQDMSVGTIDTNTFSFMRGTDWSDNASNINTNIRTSNQSATTNNNNGPPTPTSGSGGGQQFKISGSSNATGSSSSGAAVPERYISVPSNLRESASSSVSANSCAHSLAGGGVPTSRRYSSESAMSIEQVRSEFSGSINSNSRAGGGGGGGARSKPSHLTDVLEEQGPSEYTSTTRDNRGGRPRPLGYVDEAPEPGQEGLQAYGEMGVSSMSMLKDLLVSQDEFGNDISPRNSSRSATQRYQQQQQSPGNVGKSNNIHGGGSDGSHQNNAQGSSNYRNMNRYH